MKTHYIYLAAMSEKNCLRNKKIALVLLMFILQTLDTTIAQESDVVLKTRFENGFFETQAHIEADATKQTMNSIIANIAVHLRNLEIDSLQWLLKGLSGDEEGKNLIRVEYEGGAYEPTTEIIDLFIGIHFRNSHFRNIKISVLIKTDNKTYIEAELKSSNFFLKNAHGFLQIRETRARPQFAIASSVSFGWFFNLFISTSNYSSVAEWRIQSVLENLKAKAKP